MGTENRETELVTVYVTYGMLRANVIHGLLTSAGIPSMLSYEAAGPAIGVTIDGLGKVEIRVPSVWAKEARELLAADPAPDDDIPETVA
jgi:hypothetical protein